MPTFLQTNKPVAKKTNPKAPVSSTHQLDQIEQWTRFLDEAFRIPGTNIRVGWDSIIGLVPGIGDAAAAVLSLYLVHQARKAGASKWLIARMLSNVGLDMAVGAVPILGDAFDVFFKSNRRNARLLKRHLDRTSRAKTRP